MMIILRKPQPAFLSFLQLCCEFLNLPLLQAAPLGLIMKISKVE